MLYLSPVSSSCNKELLETVLWTQKIAVHIILDTERTCILFMFNELDSNCYGGIYKQMF